MQEFDVPDDPSKWLQSKIGLCVTYSLWGKNTEALEACDQAIGHRFFTEYGLPCVEAGLKADVRVIDAPGCSWEAARYDLILYVRIWQILAYKRAEEQLPALVFAIIAQYISRDYEDHKIFYDAVIAYVTNEFPKLFEDYRRAGRDTATLEHLRIVLTYGGASTPAARAARTARVLWIEQPYTKPAVYAFAAILLCAAIYIPARRPLRMLAGAALSIAQAAPGRVNAWLHPATRHTAAPVAPAPVYAPPPAPAPMPFYYNMRYPNQAYRLAGFCFAAFWILLLGPLSLALLMPIFTLLADFSMSGFGLDSG